MAPEEKAKKHEKKISKKVKQTLKSQIMQRREIVNLVILHGKTMDSKCTPLKNPINHNSHQYMGLYFENYTSNSLKH